MRLALTAGGTAGHILPAISVYEAMAARPGLVSAVCFFGPENRGERALVARSGIAFEAVPAGGLRGKGPLAAFRSLGRLAWGTLLATRRLRAFRPDAVFSTGGYASFPCSVAARLLRVPLVVFLPDVTPGWAVRAESRLATRMATTTEAALAHLPARKTTVTGYPVRQAFFATSREEARAALGLAASDRVLLIAGATQGATAINRAVFAAAAELCGAASVFHVTGAAGEAEALEARDSLPDELRGRYHPAAFRQDLPLLMLAADLGVFRAGASVLGEIPAAALPAVFVPGTYAGGHQRDNAGWLVEAGAAGIVEEAELEALPRHLRALLDDEPRLAAMRVAAAGLARPGAAAAIGELIASVARR